MAARLTKALGRSVITFSVDAFRQSLEQLLLARCIRLAMVKWQPMRLAETKTIV